MFPCLYKSVKELDMIRMNGDGEDHYCTISSMFRVRVYIHRFPAPHLFYSVSAEVNLGPVPRQLRPEKHIRLDSPVSAWIEHGRPP